MNWTNDLPPSMIDTYISKLNEFMPAPEDIEAFGNKEIIGDLLSTFERMTTWFKALHGFHEHQNTVVLLSAAHSKVIEIWILLPIGLLHSSYMALRTMVDICTSYTFYATHPVEWSAVCDGKAGWESRGNIVDWHVRYTSSFSEANKVFGLHKALDDDYRELSSYVHGIPLRGLPTLSGIERTHVSDDDLIKFVHLADKTIAHLNLMYISVFHQYLVSLPTSDFRTITRGLDRSKLATTGIFVPRL